MSRCVLKQHADIGFLDYGRVVIDYAFQLANSVFRTLREGLYYFSLDLVP